MHLATSGFQPFFFQAEDGIRDGTVTGVQTCALPISGRGIARMLGEAGATVYCTGRSVRGNLASGPNRPETIEETAEMVTAHGGVGISVQVDHSVPADRKSVV